jgi:hypothetical protein
LIDTEFAEHVGPLSDKGLTSVSARIQVFRESEFRPIASQKTKKANAVEHSEVFDHVGLLFNEPPGRSGLFFI